jgi:hypothetical protein
MWRSKYYRKLQLENRNGNVTVENVTVSAIIVIDTHDGEEYRR